MSMTSKQRVHAALRREPVERVPIFMWFHPETIVRLCRLLEIPPAHVDEVMGNDVKMTWVNNNYAMEGIVHERDGESHVDFWGIEWTKDGPFNQISRFPLAEASVPQMLEYAFPWKHKEALLGPFVANFFRPRLGDVFKTSAGVDFHRLFLVPSGAALASATCLFLFFRPPERRIEAGDGTLSSNGPISTADGPEENLSAT